MAWGYDEWLMDREARQDWMRSVALVRLTEQILQTTALAGEGLVCVLDEVLGDVNPSIAQQVEQNVAEDISRANVWVRAALATARAQAVTFQSLALVLPDSAPYRLQLALVDSPVHVEAEWADSITWRCPDKFCTAVLDGLLPLLGGLLPPQVQSKADYVLPLAYAAFLFRDVIRAAEAAEWRPVCEAIVVYDGGDSVIVPMTQPRAAQ
jgi:hypothetical protein